MLLADGFIMNLSLPSPILATLLGEGHNKWRFFVYNDPKLGYNSLEISSKNCLYGPLSPYTFSPFNSTANAINGSAPLGFIGLNNVV